MSHILYAKVPIIHQGLRQEETVVQITLALDYLEKVSTGIFQHIKSSVDRQKANLSRLQERSRNVQAKMDKLAGTNKATKVDKLINQVCYSKYLFENATGVDSKKVELVEFVLRDYKFVCQSIRSVHIILLLKELDTIYNYSVIKKT